MRPRCFWARKQDMHPVDLDKIATWPTAITDFFTAHSTQLRAEREADHAYSLSPSTHRIMHDAPAMPHWDEAEGLIEETMKDRDLVAFHATRLIDFDDVRKNGLVKLDLHQHLDRLKEHLRRAGAQEELDEVDAAVAKMMMADSWFVSREGSVWATPQRSALHNGGCDVFYESYGGEAIERIAGYARGKLESKLKTMGTPAVVTIRYPGYGPGWCKRTAGRLPQSMIELFLEAEGDWEAMDHGWDIMIERDVPPRHIVSVVGYRDPSVVA